jgi:hypothetical protein
VNCANTAVEQKRTSKKQTKQYSFGLAGMIPPGKRLQDGREVCDHGKTFTQIV